MKTSTPSDRPAAPARSEPAATAVPAVEQACRVLLALSREDGRPRNLTEICRRVGIHPSKGHNILKTLAGFGLVHRHPRRRTYSLGLGLAELGRRAGLGLDYAALAGAPLAALADEDGLVAFLGLVSGGQLYVVHKEENARGFRLDIQVGRRFPVSLGAHGLAIAAHLGPADARESEASASAAGGRALARCRRLGYALDAGRVQAGVGAAGAPVFDAGGEVIGAVVVTGTLAGRDMDRLGRRAAAAAREITRTLAAEAGGEERDDAPGRPARRQGRKES